VAGDMASAGNELRGTSSDAAPQLRWLSESIHPSGDVFMIYGNHDLMDVEHLEMRNVISRLPALLPHGVVSSVPLFPCGSTCADLPIDGCVSSSTPPATEACITELKKPSRPRDGKVAPALPPEQLVGLTKAERAALYANYQFEKRPALSKLEKQEKQWSDQNPAQAELLSRFRARAQPTLPVMQELQSLHIGAVHGIPASHSEGLRKLGRDEYFHAVDAVCSMPLDILVTHSNPQLPGQEAIVRGEDAPRLFELFMRSSAALHVHGHMHTKEVVSVVAEGKVVVNSDCRVVVLVPS